VKRMCLCVCVCACVCACVCVCVYVCVLDVWDRVGGIVNRMCAICFEFQNIK